MYLGRPIVVCHLFFSILCADEIIKAAEEIPRDNLYTIIFKDGPVSIQNRNLYIPLNCESSSVCGKQASLSQAQQHHRNWLILYALSLYHTPAYLIETIVLLSTLPITA